MACQAHTALRFLPSLSFKPCLRVSSGTTINNLAGRGAEEIKKKNSEALLQEKKILKGLPPGKKIWKGLLKEKINLQGPSPGKNKFTKAFSRKKIC